MQSDTNVNKQKGPHKNHGIPQNKKEGEDKKITREGAKKQDAPHKNHGLPADKHEPKNEDDEEDRDFGGMRGSANFRKNLGCGG